MGERIPLQYDPEIVTWKVGHSPADVRFAWIVFSLSVGSMVVILITALLTGAL